MRTQLISFVNLEKQNETAVSSVGVTCVCAQVTQSRLSLCDPMDYSPPRLLCSWDFPGKNTGMGCHFLLQGIFSIPGLNPHLLMSPALASALAGGFFTAVPPGKPLCLGLAPVRSRLLLSFFSSLLFISFIFSLSKYWLWWGCRQRAFPLWWKCKLLGEFGRRITSAVSAYLNADI